jgi:hypothetical protein
MKHIYDLFEKFADGSSLWRACVVGLQGTRLHMSDLARHSRNQFYAIHLASGKIVFHHHQDRKFFVPSKQGKRSSAAAA